MLETKRPVNKHKAYHAHVYFESETLALASDICHQVKERFGLKIGTIHQKNVGPHPKWSCQILFSSKHFEQLIPWLDANRAGLTVFVHAQTGDDLKDHTDYAYWLGNEVALNLAMFRK
ncbi:MAG: DOPA 4,5-dioxygenase family protein [Oceanospirillaceae bacterium]|nr:DOPA 4,5-dioxygenase family protein [Oceanospirillaceae bacterium]